MAADKVKIGGKTFTVKACGMTKTEAKAKAEKSRAAGMTARVIPTPGGKGFCAVEGAKSKVAGVGKAKKTAKRKTTRKRA